MKSIIYKYAAIFSLLLIFAGCGGGTQQDASMSNVAGGGIGGSGITSVGPITELGKTMTVTGVKYEIADSQVVIGKKDLGKDTSGLKLGMVVEVKGKVNSDGFTGKADLINFDANVEGSITSIDLAASTFVILGQTIVVDGKTIFEINSQIVASGLSKLAVSDYVEVSGLVGVNGNILATRVEKKTVQNESNESEVNGMVKNLNNISMTFNINNLTIDYSGALLDGFTGKQIANGDFVQAKGGVNLSSGIFIATKVEKEETATEVKDDNGTEFKLTGFISSVNKTELEILTSSGTVAIQIKETTKFDNGTIQNLIVGVKIEVEGSNVNGMLAAREISFTDRNSIGESNDDSSDSNDNNNSDSNDEPGRLLEAEVEGTLDENPSNTNSLKVSGITIDTSEALFKSESDITVSRQTFYSLVSAGTFIKAEGNMTGISSLKATKVSIKKNSDDD